MTDRIGLTTTEGFEDGTMREVDLERDQFLVSRVGDQYYITDARCPHMGGELAYGELDGTIVTCPRHHSQFDVRDGSVVRWTDWSGMALSVAKLARHPRPIRAYECKIEDGMIWVGPQKMHAEVASRA
jgi:3-phenylpropionate/trans-cinnamate dioxygenase ferredoxin component